MFRIILATLAAAFISSASAQTTVFTTTFTANSSGNAGISVRETTPALSTGGSQIRVWFNAPTTTAFSASHVSVCVQASGYNCVSTPVEVTYHGGFSGVSEGPFYGPIASDWINFSTTPGQTLLIIYDITTDTVTKNGAGLIGWDNYPTGGPTWNVATPTGSSWPSFNYTYGVWQIDVQTPASGNAMLSSPGIQGGTRLTLDPNNARMQTDTQSSTIYLVTDTGVTDPVIDGTGTTQNPLTSGLSMTLDNSWAAGGIFDIYLAWNGGTPVLCSAPARTAPNYFPAAPDTFFNGVKVNGTAIGTCRTSASSSISVPQYQGKFKGSIKVSSIAGVLRCDFSYKQMPECGVWNNDNQIDMVLQAGNWEPLSGGPYGNGGYNMSGSWGPLHGDPNNALKVFSGRPELVKTTLDRASRDNWQSPNGSSYIIGIGINSTNNPSGLIPGVNMEWYTSGTTVPQMDLGTSSHVELVQQSVVGAETVTALEQCAFGTCVTWVIGTNELLQSAYKN